MNTETLTKASAQPEQNFHCALEALRTDQMNEMQSGIELGKKQLKAVMNTINSNIEMGNVISAGPFLYMVLKEIVLNIMQYCE